jgi:hypothetical protein
MLSAWLGANSITPQHPRYDPKTLRGLAVLLVPAAYSVSFRQDFVGQTEAPLIGRYLSNRSKAAPAVLPPAQRTIDRWRTFVLAILVLASVFARPGNISAQGFYYPGNVTAPGWWYWVPLEIGCARSIAVGPNGVPWVLGCEDGPNGTGPARVYYLSYSNQDSLIPYQWDYDNFSAMTLSVNLQGVPNATDVNGVVWAETANNGDFNGGYYMEPSGVWVPISNAGAGAIASQVGAAK